MEIEMKNLRVSDETHRKLTDLEIWRYGESMNDIICKLIDSYLELREIKAKDRDRERRGGGASK